MKDAIKCHFCFIYSLFRQADLVNCFSTTTHNKWEIALEYVKGLITGPSRRHLTSIAQNCSEINNQAFSHFLSRSPWDHQLLVEWIMDIGWRIIGKNGALVIDECGNPKAGNHSVGVKRQYCGNLGKVENCQVGVFMAYVKSGFRILLDFRLYLPKSWTDDFFRCSAAEVPLRCRNFKPKAELAYDLICDAVKAKIRFSHINMDGFYGSQPWLLTRLEQMKLIYVADICSNDRVLLEKPEYGVPLKKGIRGRKPSCLKIINTTPVRVNDIAKIIDRWRVMRIRESMDGFLEVKFTAIRVWRLDKDVIAPIPVWLLIRKELDDSDIKFSLCNAIHIYSWDRLLTMQNQRYWIERSFEDAIELAGMADYQVRNWKAWHHHMALVLLAMIWITKEQKHFLKVIKKVTPQDIARILKQKIPLIRHTALSVATIIIQNHLNRKNSRRCKMRKKGRPSVF